MWVLVAFAYAVPFVISKICMGLIRLLDIGFASAFLSTFSFRWIWNLYVPLPNDRADNSSITRQEMKHYHLPDREIRKN